MRFTDSTRRLDFLWRRCRGRPDRRLLCVSEPRLPREVRGRRLQPLLLRRGGPELRELSARRDDGMARATRCRRGARLNTTPPPILPFCIHLPHTQHATHN